MSRSARTSSCTVSQTCTRHGVDVGVRRARLAHDRRAAERAASPRAPCTPISPRKRRWSSTPVDVERVARSVAALRHRRGSGTRCRTAAAAGRRRRPGAGSSTRSRTRPRAAVLGDRAPSRRSTTGAAGTARSAAWAASRHAGRYAERRCRRCPASSSASVSAAAVDLASRPTRVIVSGAGTCRGDGDPRAGGAASPSGAPAVVGQERVVGRRPDLLAGGELDPEDRRAHRSGRRGSGVGGRSAASRPATRPGRRARRSRSSSPERRLGAGVGPQHPGVGGQAARLAQVAHHRLLVGALLGATVELARSRSPGPRAPWPAA